MKTYRALILILGRRSYVEVWAANLSDARQKIQAAYPDADILSLDLRRVF